MVTFNSSVNLFIYCGFGKKFRREFKKLLGLKVDTIEVGKKGYTCIFQFGNYSDLPNKRTITITEF